MPSCSFRSLRTTKKSKISENQRRKEKNRRSYAEICRDWKHEPIYIKEVLEKETNARPYPGSLRIDDGLLV